MFINFNNDDIHHTYNLFCVNIFFKFDFLTKSPFFLTDETHGMVGKKCSAQKKKEKKSSPKAQMK